MDKLKHQYELGRLAGLKKACELTGVIATGKQNYEPLLTLIRELNIKLDGTTPHESVDDYAKDKARSLISDIKAGCFLTETEEDLIKGLINKFELEDTNAD